MGASLEERVKRRQPEEILVAISERLRKFPSGLTQSALKNQLGLEFVVLERYIDLISCADLIKVRVENGHKIYAITDKGQHKEWTPDFVGFTSKKRTRFQLWRAIADAVYRHNGAASAAQIMCGVSFSYNGIKRHITEMMAEGYLAAIPAERRAEKYGLTAEGREKFPGSDSLKDGQDKRLHILETARTGANKTRLMNSAETNLLIINNLLGSLLKHGLLRREYGGFITTSLYDNVDKEALPYALDSVSERKRRTSRLIELECLVEMTVKPCYATRLKMLVDNSKRFPEVLGSLVQGQYALRTVQGRRTAYQITPEGQRFVEKVYKTIDVLTVAAERAA